MPLDLLCGFHSDDHCHVQDVLHPHHGHHDHSGHCRDAVHGHQDALWTAASSAALPQPRLRGVRVLSDFLSRGPTATHGTRAPAASVGASFLDNPALEAAKLPAGPGVDFLGEVPGAAATQLGWDASGGRDLELSLGTLSSNLSVSSSRFLGALQTAPPQALVPLHAVSVMFALPGHILFELGEGYFFGFKEGLALAMAGKYLGSVAAFGVGRCAFDSCGLRDSLNRFLESTFPTARSGAKSVERGGALSVVLLTVAPVPCILKNYSLAIFTDIPWGTFAPAKLLGLIPTTIAHVYAGTLAPSAADLANGVAGAPHLMGVAATVAGVGLLSLAASYCLRERALLLGSEGGEQEDDRQRPAKGVC